MPVMFFDLDRKICLTCQYFQIDRQIVTFGPKVGISYSGSLSTCSIGRDQHGRPFPRAWGFPSTPGAAGCHYKRWIELP